MEEQQRGGVAFRELRARARARCRPVCVLLPGESPQRSAGAPELCRGRVARTRHTDILHQRQAARGCAAGRDVPGDPGYAHRGIVKATVEFLSPSCYICVLTCATRRIPVARGGAFREGVRRGRNAFRGESTDSKERTAWQPTRTVACATYSFA